MNFWQGPIQTQVLAEALRIGDLQSDGKGYDLVFDGVMAVVHDSAFDGTTKQAIGRLGERIARTGAGRPQAGSVLHSIATAGWEDAGISGVPALTTEDRATLIDIVVGVSKQVIASEVARLQTLVESETALPSGWDA